MEYHIANYLTTLNKGIQRLLLFSVIVETSLGGDLSQYGVLEVPNARSAFAPSAAFFDGRVFLGWRGSASPDSTEDDQQLYLASHANDEWTHPRPLSVKSMFGPVLAASRDHLFIAWHGSGKLFSGTGDSRLYFASLQRDGRIKYLGAVPGAMSAGPPGLAVYKGLVYMGWRSLGNITVGMVPGNQHWIDYRVFDPRAGEWVDVERKGGNIVHANSSSGPIFAPVGENLYSLWRGTGSITFYGPNSDPGAPYIYYGSFDGTAWSTLQLPLPTIPGALTAWSPGAVEWKGGLLVGWRGDQPRNDVPGDTTLSFALLGADEQWKTVDLFEGSKPGSAFAPSLVADEKEDALWIFWRGVLDRMSSVDDQQVYSATFFEPLTAGNEIQ